MTSLYHTLRSQRSADEDTTKLSAAQKKIMLAKFKEIGQSNDNATKALIIMLIAEHGKVTGSVDVDSLVKNHKSQVLPYGMKQNQKDVVFDVENLDDQLVWILWKFLNLEILHPKKDAPTKSKTAKKK